MAINWRSGYSAIWRVMTVNKTTWADQKEVFGVKSVSVDRDCTDDVPLLESGTMKYTSKLPPKFTEGYYRIELIVEQGSERQIVPISTLLCSSQAGEITRNYSEMDVDCFSVLKPASEVYFNDGEYAPIKVNGAQWCAEKLRAAGVAAPVKVTGSFTLNKYYIFDNSTSYLAGVWTILKAANFVMMIFGDGVIEIRSRPTAAYLRINKANCGYLLTEINYNGSIDRIPNRYLAVNYDGKSATAINNNSNSPTSYSKRGRYIDYKDYSPALVNGESLKDYAIRRLKEESTIVEKYSYTREFHPEIVPCRIIEFDLPNLGMVGNYKVLKQQLKFDKGVTVSETVGKEVVTYAE